MKPELKSFDEQINGYNIVGSDLTEFNLAFKQFVSNNYDIMSFNGTITLNPGDTPLLVRDYITDIISDEPLYYVIDNTEYLITHKTRLFTFLTSLKTIILRNKSNKIQNIRFKRWFVKNEIYSNLLSNTIIEEDVIYYYNEAHNYI